MSDQDDRDLLELERQLDVAFRSTHPRPGFEDELWTRLRPRRPWWRLPGLPAVSLPALGAVAAVLVAALVTLAVLRDRPGGGTTSGASSQAAPINAPAARPGGAFGALPPASPGPARAAEPAQGVPGGTVDVQGGVAAVPAVLPVYRYQVGAGPAAGTVLDPASVPPGLASATYPTRTAVAAAQDESQGGGSVVVTGARLVYLAVVSDGQGYLEPAYELTGTRQAPGGPPVPFTAVVPALAASAFR